ncbi:MAG TPA: OsmC family protein [Trueperaceae bacterium]|nr:OsmC family protein [Trueperaceae bacterium]
MSKTLISTVHNLGGMRFMGETADGQRVMIDNEKVARTGMSPMQLMLNAVGACAGMDVSHMLAKRKLSVNSYTIQMTGERPDDVPSPFTRVVAKHVFDVPGLERAMAERLVDLAMNKYCSVGASLNAELSYEVELLHEVGDARPTGDVVA